MNADVTPGDRTGLRPTRETKISELLKAYPEIIEALARFNKHFELLRRPALRKLMAPLVTIEKAARTAQVEPSEMLAAIYQAIGQPLPADLGRTSPTSQPAGTPVPDEIRNLPEDRRVIMDVREDVRAGEEPYHRIMKALAALRNDQTLQLCNIFEPVPLYDVLEHHGFSHWAEQRGPTEWWITISRMARPAPSSIAPSQPAPTPAGADGVLVVDARGLEPPQPMAKILEALPRVGGGRQILALTDRRPMLLYPKLEERGFTYRTEESGNGWFETHIWK